LYIMYFLIREEKEEKKKREEGEVYQSKVAGTIGLGVATPMTRALRDFWGTFFIKIVLLNSSSDMSI
jgi:hypothetical protein